MEELKIQQEYGIINTNLDAIESELKEKMAEYKDYLVTEDSIKADKKVLADLRKLEKELNDARIATKKKWLEPYEAFETRCKQVVALVSEPISLINTQIKAFDETKKIEKQAHVKELYEENIQGLSEFLPFDRVMNANPKWLNASCKDTDILFDLNAMTLKVKNDLSAIKALNSEIESEVVEVYKNNGNDLSAAIQRNSQYLSDKQKVVEQVKETKAEVKKETPVVANESVMTIRITGAENIEKVKSFLDFSEIPFEEV